MASRSLTEVFILMRNNAMQSRHIYSEQVSVLRKFRGSYGGNSSRCSLKGFVTYSVVG